MAKIKKTTKADEPKFGLFYAFFIFSFLILTAFIIYNLADKIYRQNEIDLEVEKLEKEIDKLTKKNQKLNEAINYLKTEDFKEKEFKKKLNLIKEGEELVLIKESETVQQLNEEELSEKEFEKAKLIVKRPNYYYWWYYFFSI